MTIKEATKFMERIKQHYQEFIIDEYKIEEWFNDLQHYSYEDVNKKLDEHLRSERYGEYIPKLHFLLSSLIMEKDKGKDWLKEAEIKCNICGRVMKYYDYDNHFARHLSVDYIAKQYLKYKNEEIDKEKFLKMDDEEFEIKYDKILKFVYENTNDEEEKDMIRNYFKSYIG